MEKVRFVVNKLNKLNCIVKCIFLNIEKFIVRWPPSQHVQNFKIQKQNKECAFWRERKLPGDFRKL